MTRALVQQVTGSKGWDSIGFKTIPQGAATTSWAGGLARIGEEVGGCYCEECRVTSVRMGTKVRVGGPSLRSGRSSSTERECSLPSSGI